MKEVAWEQWHTLGVVSGHNIKLHNPRGEKMVIYVKNMVCTRCKMIVQSILEGLKIDYLSVELGRVKLAAALLPEQKKSLSSALLYYKLELMDNKKKVLTEQIKVVIVELFEEAAQELILKFSEHLSSRLHYDYTYLANVFSETEGTTIERFYISYRIERAKELIVYEGLEIKEISYRLNFSSVAHFSQQFKKVAGLTPAMFRKLSVSEDYVWRTCE